MSISSKNSISRKLLFTIFIITTIIIAFLATVFIFMEYNKCNKECDLLTETYIKEQEVIVKYEVERAVSEIEYDIINSVDSLEYIRKEVFEHLAKIRFPNKGKELGIYFAKSYAGIQMLSLSKPELVGKDLSQFIDPNGINTHELFMSIVSDTGSGFADYSWFNPITKKIQKKRSFIKGIPELQCYIGAGFWFEDINSVIQAKKLYLKNEVRNYILRLLLIIIITYIIIFIVSQNISNKIRDSFRKFSLFFKKAATQQAYIEKGELHYLEFKELADFANKMISERIKAEEDVRVMAHAFKSISDCVTITDLDNNVLYVNKSFLNTYGYSYNEIIGNKIDLFGSSQNPKKQHENILNETINGGWTGELWNTRKDGSEFQISLSTSIIKNNNKEIFALVGVSKDITVQKRAEKLQKIIYNIAQAVNITENLDELIHIIKNQLQLIIDARNFYVAFYNEEDDTFNSPYALDENDDFDTWPAAKSLSSYIYKSNKSKLLTSDDILQLEKTGEVVTFGARAKVWLGVPLRVKGKTFGVFAVQNYENKDAYTKNDLEMLEFVSHQISISIERKKNESELKAAYEKALESDRLKSAFLATMSHELRTPLNAIIGFSDLIKENIEIEKVLHFAGIVNKSGRHLLEIVEDLFDVTLLEVGQTNITKDLYSLASIMQTINELITVEKIKLNSKIDIKYKPLSDANELYVYTDKLKLKQILINLLKNAIKFTKEGFVEYGYEKVNENGISKLKFYVKDTGIGIAKDKQDIIFKIFRQADDTLTRNFGGTGIGLFVVMRYTEILGGKVELDSREGIGSTFYVTIPYLKPKNLPEKSKTENILHDMTSIENKTILIVEDDEVSSKFLIEILKGLKVKYITASNGNEAVKSCKENKDIDLVLMDIKMPDMNGYEATKIIKKNRPNLVVVAQTAHAVPGDREEVLKAGCDEYITKPIIQDDLVRIIHDLLITSARYKK